MSIENIPSGLKKKNRETKESLEDSTQILNELQDLENNTHLSHAKKEIKKDVLDNIDITDGISPEEQMYLHIVDDFFDGFLEEWGIDDVSDDDKHELIRWIKSHGYTTKNLDILAKNLRQQSSKMEQTENQDKRAKVGLVLAAAMGGCILDQLDERQDMPSIGYDFALLVELQEYSDKLTKEQKEKKAKKREKLLMDIFEWKNLEIYEVVIDESGRVIITMKDPHGELVTIAYDPVKGEIDHIGAGGLDTIVPADQKKIAQIIDNVDKEESLPYDPNDMGTLLQYIS